MSADERLWPARFIDHRHGCDEKHSKRQACNTPEETPVSTDDLMTRVRDHLVHADALPHGLAIALVSELADEVDRLRAENERHHAQYVEAVDTAVHAGLERDAARAALERVRAVVEDGDRLDGLWTYAPDLERALEGES